MADPKDSPEAIAKAAQLDKRHQYIDGDGKLRNQVRVKSPDGKVQWRTKRSVLPVEQRLGQTKDRSLIKTRTSDHYLGTKRESIKYSKANDEKGPQKKKSGGRVTRSIDGRATKGLTRGSGRT